MDTMSLKQDPRERRVSREEHGVPCSPLPIGRNTTTTCVVVNLKTCKT